MTKRDFLRLIIKLFALYSLILTVFSFIPANISYITQQFDIFIALLILGVAAIIGLIYVILIKKTDKIIDALKLDKGFDEEHIHMENFNNLNIIKLATLLVGGFLIVDYFPEFLNHCFFAFRRSVSNNDFWGSVDEVVYGTRIDYFNWAISVMNLILGYILITNYHRISTWLIKKENNS